MANLVESWFGPAFAGLHPQLQALHRHGGVLVGEVDVGMGHGPARRIASRLARKVGIPEVPGLYAFRVEIAHAPDALCWNRTFGAGAEMRSRFRPVGRFPEGHWVEETGPVALELGVAIRDGGWHWEQRGVLVRRLRVPVTLVPRTRAFKRISAGRYEFVVEFSLPMIGTLLWYRGVLDMQAPAPAADPSDSAAA